jgi:hypothetical protein
MVNFQLTEEEKNWLLEKYPGLETISGNENPTVSGEFHFDAIYENHRITDSYKVTIEFKVSAVSNLPRVREIDSRIKQVAKDRNLNLADLHTYSDGTACLCVKPDETNYFPVEFSFQKFIEELVVPFFYAQSYFEHRNVWPWETYSHGSLGWLEWYSDQEFTSDSITSDYIRELQKQPDWRRIRRALTRSGGPKSYRLCFCGGAKSYWNCHRKAFRGLHRLSKDMKIFQISP